MQANPERMTQPETRASAIRRILLATDLSAASEAAADQALGLARDLDAELLVVHVADHLGPSRRESCRQLDRLGQREGQARALAARARKARVRATFLVPMGDPGPSIVEAARNEGVDLVVVGSRGRGRFGQFLLGSVSQHVVAHARCPVLVARPWERHDHLEPIDLTPARSVE